MSTLKGKQANKFARRMLKMENKIKSKSKIYWLTHSQLTGRGKSKGADIFPIKGKLGAGLTSSNTNLSPREPADNTQFCLCGHSLDEHVGNNQLEECMHKDCHCASYEEDSQQKNPKTNVQGKKGDADKMQGVVGSHSEMDVPKCEPHILTAKPSTADKRQDDAKSEKSGHPDAPASTFHPDYPESEDEWEEASKGMVNSQQNNPEQKASDDFFQQEIVDYYKGKAGKEFGKADRLLMDTARNNYNKGFEDGLNCLHNKSRKVCWEDGYRKAIQNEIMFLEGTIMEYWQLHDVKARIRNKIEKLKGELKCRA